MRFPLGAGVVGLRPDGSIEGVWADADATSYLDAGGRVVVRVAGREPDWSEPTIGADLDEVELDYGSDAGLGLTVRHSFSGGWGVRVTLVNHTLDPLAVAADLEWSPAPESPAWALAAGATGAYAIPPPDGRGPLLGGELTLGTCDRVSGGAIGLGTADLGPLERRVVQWRWNWFDHPRAFNETRFVAVPRDLVLPEGDAALIAADDDEAVVAPGVDMARWGGHLELSSVGAHQVTVEVSSRRGATYYQLEWVPPLDEMLAEVGNRVLAGPVSRAGVVLLAGVDAALLAQRMLVRGAADDPEQVEDALGLFADRLDDTAVDDGRTPAFLCGEFERTAEPDLLERATAAVLRLGPVPGLGLAAAQVCLARLQLGRPVQAVLDHLASLAADDGADDLDRTAIALELHGMAAPRTAEGRAGPDVDRWLTRVGAALGAGLRGRPVRPRPVDQHAYLAVALALLPEGLAARARPDWGCRPLDVARRAEAEVLARLGFQPPRPAHSWLIMGARLA